MDRTSRSGLVFCDLTRAITALLWELHVNATFFNLVLLAYHGLVPNEGIEDRPVG